MRTPFVDSASFLSPDMARPQPAKRWLLTFALVMAVAASSAVLLAF